MRGHRHGALGPWPTLQLNSPCFSDASAFEGLPGFLKVDISVGHASGSAAVETSGWNLSGSTLLFYKSGRGQGTDRDILRMWAEATTNLGLAAVDDFIPDLGGRINHTSVYRSRGIPNPFSFRLPRA